MTRKLQVLICVIALAAATHASANITMYRGEGFRGRAQTFGGSIRDIRNTSIATRGEAVVIDRGAWEVCDGPGFSGNCVVLRAGSYDSMSAMGLDGGVLSARSARQPPQYREIPPPLAEPNYEYRQRPRERIYEARVLSVRAVVGPPEQRCWIEREQVVEREEPNAKGALVGALIGGILGHRISDGRGAGTAGGAIAGAAIGSQVGRDADVYEQDVQRCADVPPGPPDYWDVTYDFRGTLHRVQMSAPPGSTISVNREGEPRQ